MKKLQKFKSFFTNAYNFLKLVKMLKGWQNKYQPSEYDNVINNAFDLIDSYNLQSGKLSPSFTLPNEQLDTEFIKKFMLAAKDHGYKILSNPAEKENYTKFNFTR